MNTLHIHKSKEGSSLSFILILLPAIVFSFLVLFLYQTFTKNKEEINTQVLPTPTKTQYKKANPQKPDTMIEEKEPTQFDENSVPEPSL